MTEVRQNTKYVFILLVLSYFFFMFGNGVVSLSNPDEVFYAQTAREMAKHASWLTPYLFDTPNFEKPIFLYWLLRIGFILFGVSSFAARFFPAVFAALGVVAVYYLGLFGFKNSRKAFFSALVLMSSGLYIGLARTVFTDMVFSIFILFSLVSFFWAYTYKEKKDVGILLFFVSLGFAVLTKGPLGLFIPTLTVLTFLIIRKDIKWIFCKCSLWGLFVFILISFPWYVFMIAKYGNAFTHEFFYNDHIRRILEAEHAINDTWFFYPLSMFGGMFPWSLYVIVSLGYSFKNLRRNSESLSIFLTCWILVVLCIFQPAHSKLASYIFPLFPALAMVTGNFVFNVATSQKKPRSLFYISIITALVFVIILIGLGVNMTIFSKYIRTYLSSSLSVYILFGLLSILTVSFFVLILKHKFVQSIFVLMCVIPAVFCIIPVISRDIEPFISSKDTCAYLFKNYKVDNTLLCSKFFVRGLRYYTDKPVAVIAPYTKNFFSPHPIPFLDSDQKVAEFLRKQSVTYCVFKKSSIEDIERIAKQEFDFAILKTIGNEYILKVQPLKKKPGHNAARN